MCFFAQVLILLDIVDLFPPLHNFRAHLHKACFRFAVREARNSLDGLVDIFLREYASLFETGAAGNNLAGLCVLLACFQYISKILSLNWRRTLCTSPSSANFLPTNLPRLLLSFHANNSGAVASPSSRSAPAGFPNSSPEIV
jgi:hypothetical protein